MLANVELSMLSSAGRTVLETTVSIAILKVLNKLTDCAVGNSYTNSLKECLESCDKTPGCVDVSFVNGQPGPCYKKNAVGAIVPNSNVWGGRQMSGCIASVAKLKLHRKRVVKTDQKTDQKPGVNRFMKRGLALGPDFTFFQGQAQTTTTTSVITQTLATT
jgi:hypothetical protein